MIWAIARTAFSLLVLAFCLLLLLGTAHMGYQFGAEDCRLGNLPGPR